MNRFIACAVTLAAATACDHDALDEARTAMRHAEAAYMIAAEKVADPLHPSDEYYDAQEAVDQTRSAYHKAARACSE